MRKCETERVSLSFNKIPGSQLLSDVQIFFYYTFKLIVGAVEKDTNTTLDNNEDLRGVIYFKGFPCSVRQFTKLFVVRPLS